MPRWAALEDGAARRLVDAARLHADEAVLHQIEPADAVGAAELVEAGRAARPATASRRRSRPRRRARTRSRHSCGLSGAFSGATVRLIDEFLGLVPRGLPAPCPRPEMCSRLASTENGASPRLSLAIGIWCFSAIFDQLGARGQVPFAPRRDHLDVGLERVIAELEAHLVVALAGGAVGDRVGAGLGARSRSGAWRSAAARSRCRADRGPRRARWRGTSGRRSRARIPRADPR